ncbi:LutC/YkgG family protein [Shouchella patagoniensis]|uniref:LutC/YkgG family protein n=1 Tax=Shouchella patagoniensis TaxID=228576 RepID=UPI000995CD9C|nr:lactate utilization protein C [Shouchella patagoniensis]
MIEKREPFLDHLAKQLGRDRKTEGVVRPSYKHAPQLRVMENYSQDELVGVLKDQCLAIHTDFKQTIMSRLEETIDIVLKEYAAHSVITWDDPRFNEFGLSNFLKREQVDLWETHPENQSIELAEKADVGITFTDCTLAESGTVTLLSGNGKGRSVSLLPRYYIAIIPKSSLVPRITQATTRIHELAQAGRLPSCINFISGPSNSADIEMSLVVGVHGPLRACYILVDDK